MMTDGTTGFGEFVLDRRTLELRRAGDRVSIRPKPLQLLIYLLSNRDRVVTKHELREHVWKGATVSNEALTSALRDLRKALGDGASPHRVVVTVHGTGYRLLSGATDPKSGEVWPCSPQHRSSHCR